MSVAPIPAFDPASPLIGPDDPPPYEVLNPDGRAGLLLICDHASRMIPVAFDRLGLPAAALERHIAYDIGAARVTRLLSGRLDAPAVLAGYSRLLIDLNRQPGDPESIVAASDGIDIPGNRDLSEAQRTLRVESFFRPYHHAVTNALAHIWRRGPAPALLSVHSFTPVLDGRRRAWDVGVLWNRDSRLALPLIRRLRSRAALDVGDNEPYSGRERAYSIDHHAGAVGLPNCAVEIRQDHLESEAGAMRWADVLAEALAGLLEDETLRRVERF